jgi:hypothetical protein
MNIRENKLFVFIMKIVHMCLEQAVNQYYKMEVNEYVD